MSPAAPPPPLDPDDRAVVERLRNADYRAGYLRSTIVGLRDGMAWAASLLDPAGRERQLLERRIRDADHVLKLLDRVDAEPRGPLGEQKGGEQVGEQAAGR